MPDAYTTKQAAEATGIARPTLRLYTGLYARYLSTGATPDKGKARAFTEADLRTLAFVYAHSRTQETHEAIKRRLEAGELEAFDWQPPEDVQEAPGAQESTSTALVSTQALQLAQTLVQEAQARAQALEEENKRLLLELGQAQGRLQVYEKRKRPRWLVWLAGE